MNIEQQRVENRKVLEDLGGIDALVNIMGLNMQTGWTKEQVHHMREKFGENVYPESPMDNYLELLLDALSDPTLIILICAATVSLIIGAIEEPENGWIEGVAIFIAVFLVSNISAGNDYTKQLQFRALEHSSAKDERTSVLREGAVERVNPSEIVVGDIIVLQVISHIISCVGLLSRLIIVFGRRVT